MQLISPASSLNCSQGLASGRSQRQGFDTHCYFGASARRKQGGNDVPQLPFPDGQSGVLWSEESAAMEVPAMQHAIL
jgi:hypothetical protein